MQRFVRLCSMAPLFLLLGLLPLALAGHDYGQALTKSILFFEAQRSGYLSSTQRVQWRGHSGLNDSKANGVDLVGGYYDAGDNVKFGLPMAFTITIMSWSIVEYGRQMAASGELSNAMEAVKWGTDYLIKAHPHPFVLYGEVGDGNTDHYCWQRPEDMTTSRQAYKIDPNNPGSDLTGETAAAMAAASVVFRHHDPSYANALLTHAQQDELLWAAAWLYKATNNQYYLNYLGNNGDSLGGTGWAMTEFGWDVKYAGVQTLVAKVKFLKLVLQFLDALFDTSVQGEGRVFLCSCLGKGTRNAQKTPGGLIFRQRWNNLQFVTSASFLLSVYSDNLTSARKNLKCASGSVSLSVLLSFAKSQVDYILGDNPRATSYMVGYGNNYPQQVHHRASSIVSFKDNPSFVNCHGDYAKWFSRKASNPNLLTEPATYNNAPLLGILARLHSGHSGYNQLLPVTFPAPKTQPKPAPVTGTTPSQVSSSAPIAIEQKMTSSWDYNGKTYYRYSTTVTNKSPKTLKFLYLSISKLYGPLWGLTKSGDSYVFPAWLNSLPAGKSLEFVYIHSASQANVSVSSYNLA
ncbi:Endoglucanase 6 [Camellia lanceoleosa]|uniref:Endoglucanase 6 n=1 Tax=Camellia lanceoleosa TaxID=1840588 RepID=A0ACC0G538_9ERIC|nr:Endoglucanase 6 [Camellia lanceoleosa]